MSGFLKLLVCAPALAVLLLLAHASTAYAQDTVPLCQPEYETCTLRCVEIHDTAAAYNCDPEGDGGVSYSGCALDAVGCSARQCGWAYNEEWCALPGYQGCIAGPVSALQSCVEAANGIFLSRTDYYPGLFAMQEEARRCGRVFENASLSCRNDACAAHCAAQGFVWGQWVRFSWATHAWDECLCMGCKLQLICHTTQDQDGLHYAKVGEMVTCDVNIENPSGQEYRVELWSGSRSLSDAKTNVESYISSFAFDTAGDVQIGARVTLPDGSSCETSMNLIVEPASAVTTTPPLTTTEPLTDSEPVTETERITRTEVITPEAVLLNAYWDPDNRIRLHTSHYDPSLIVYRRAADFVAVATVQGFDSTRHELRWYADDVRLAPFSGGESWAADPLGVSGTDFAFSIFAPVDAEIGTHTLKVELVNTQRGTTLGNLELDEFYLVFNPYNDDARPDIYDDDVYDPAAPLDDRELAYLLGNLSVDMSSGVHYAASPGNKSVFLSALRLAESAANHSSAAQVARAMVRTQRSICLGKWGKIYPGILDWDPATGDSVPNADYSEATSPLRLPRAWQRAEEILGPWLAGQGQQKYCQCWVYGFLTDALERALGIPSAAVTGKNTAHDDNQDQVAETVFTWDRAHGRYDGAGEVWSFHVWNEAWLPGFVGRSDATAIVDGTYQIGPVRRWEVPAAAGSRDTRFVHDEINLAWRVKYKGGPRDGQIINGDPPVAAAVNSLLYGNVLAAYTGRVSFAKVAGLAQEAPEIAVLLTTEPLLYLGAPLPVALSVTNAGPESEVKIVLMVQRLPDDLSGGSDVTAAPYDLAYIEEMSLVLQAGETWQYRAEVPAGNFAQAARYLVDVTVAPAEGVTAYARAFTVFTGLPVSLDTPDQVISGETFTAMLVVTNPTASSINGVVVSLSLPADGRVDSLSGEQDVSLNAGASRRLTMAVTLTQPGTALLIAYVDAPDVGLSSVAREIEVLPATAEDGLSDEPAVRPPDAAPGAPVSSSRPGGAPAGASPELPTAIEVENNDRFADANPLAPPGVQGSITPQRDGDWYRLELPSRGALDLRIAPMPPGLDIVVRVYDANKEIRWDWSPRMEPGVPLTASYDIPSPGAWYLELRDSFEDAGSAVPYGLAVNFTPIVEADEPNDSFGRATPLSPVAQDEFAAPGQTLPRAIYAFTGTILPRRDIDWLQITSDGAAELLIDINAGATDIQPVLRVWTRDKEVLRDWMAPPAGTNRLTATIDLPWADTYWLELHDDWDRDWSALPYTLLLTMTHAADANEPNNTFSTATPIETGVPTVGAILPQRDRDWYAVTVAANNVLTVAVHDVPPALNMAVRIWDSDKTLVEDWHWTAEAGETLLLEKVLVAPGTYYLEVADSSDDARSPQGYTLRVDSAAAR